MMAFYYVLVLSKSFSILKSCFYELFFNDFTHQVSFNRNGFFELPLKLNVSSFFSEKCVNDEKIKVEKLRGLLSQN